MPETLRSCKRGGMTVKTKLGRFLFAEELRRVIEPLVVEGVCLECGSVQCNEASPVFLPHKPTCPGLRRMAQAGALVRDFFPGEGL